MFNHKLFVALLGVFVVGLVITSFTLGNSPLEWKNQKLDSTRMRDIRNISYKISNYHGANLKFPSTLEDANAENIVDPVTKKTYDYIVINSNSYKLCTTFLTEVAKKDNRYSYDDNLYHKKGYDCIFYSVSTR